MRASGKFLSALLATIVMLTSLVGCASEQPTSDATASPSATPTNTSPEPSESDTVSLMGEDDDDTSSTTKPPAASPSATAKSTPSPTATATSTPAPTSTPTAAPTPSPTPTPTPTPTSTPTPTPTPTPEPTPEPTPTPAPSLPTASDASAYIGSGVGSLYSAIGYPPNGSSYASSCLGEGEDGELYYIGFTVYTYRHNGAETVQAVF